MTRRKGALSKAEQETLRKLYAVTPDEELAEIMNRTQSYLTREAKLMGLEKLPRGTARAMTPGEYPVQPWVTRVWGNRMLDKDDDEEVA